MSSTAWSQVLLIDRLPNEIIYLNYVLRLITIQVKASAAYIIFEELHTL
jgi:hypothetical protein